MYRSLKPAAGLPAVYWCGPAGAFNVMVMELLGDSLETLYNKCCRQVLAEDGDHAGHPAAAPHRAPPHAPLPAPRHQARQLPHGPQEQRAHPLPHRHGPLQAVPRPRVAGAHPVPREQEAHRHSALRLHQHAPGRRAVQEGRPGEHRLHAHVLPQRQASMAGTQGAHQAGEVRQDQQQEDEHLHRLAVQERPAAVRHLPHLSAHRCTQPSSLLASSICHRALIAVLFIVCCGVDRLPQSPLRAEAGLQVPARPVLRPVPPAGLQGRLRLRLDARPRLPPRRALLAPSPLPSPSSPAAPSSPPAARLLAQPSAPPPASSTANRPSGTWRQAPTSSCCSTPPRWPRRWARRVRRVCPE